MKTPLRIGLLLDSYSLKAWQELSIRRILEGDFATIELIVLNRSKHSAAISDRIPYLAYRAYSRLDRMLFCPKADAFEVQDGKALLSGIPALEIEPEQKKYSDSFKREDTDKIKEFNLDVLIRFGFRILRGEILRAARTGVWSYHHGDNSRVRGGPPGFWEVMERHPVTGSTLQILTEDLDNGKVLTKSLSVTNPISVIRNRNNYYWKTALFLPRKLKELHTLGERTFLDRVEKDNQDPELYSRRLYRNPRNVEMIRNFIRLAFRTLLDKLKEIFHLEQWVILFSFQKDLPASLWRFQKMLPPKDRFWADPHILQRDGGYFVFIEEFLFKPWKGHISVIELDRAGQITQPRKVLERPYHLSYPFVFEWENKVYMLPESSSNRTIELYKSVEFPDRWEFQMNLMEEVLAADSTLFYHEKKWWLFTNLREQQGVSPFDELFLFHSDELFSKQWIAHPFNPIVSDCRSARPAGRIFVRNGKIYRPSQNCSYRYGYGIKLQEIKILSETDYEESEVTSIEPDWDNRITRVHTLNHEGELAVADAKLRTWRW